VEVHQVLVGAAPGDAITSEAFELRTLLRRQGASEIFAFHRHPGIADEVRALAEYAVLPSARDGGNVLLFHASIGQPEVAAFLHDRRERLVVRYHNITPAEMFEELDPGFAALLRAGREELVALRDRATLALADSRFNEAELMEAGFRDTTVVPLVLDYGAMADAPPRPTERVVLPAPDAGPVVTFVGRVAPNKGHRHLIAAFHVLKTYRRPDAHLVMVGRPFSDAHQRGLERFVDSLCLPDVNFAGGLSQRDLVAVYRRADVFLCLSEHEGFCVPLVEAMSFGVPVVAWGATAVGETMGGAGIVLDGPHPELAAEAVAAVLDDRALRDELVARGRRRYQDFALERTGPAFLAALERLA
jgi:glycosyltransferase involved in cell wall biosynthesis